MFYMYLWSETDADKHEKPVQKMFCATCRCCLSLAVADDLDNHCSRQNLQ